MVFFVVVYLLSPGQLIGGPYQAPLSTSFSRQEYQRQLPFPTPGDLPDPGIEPVSLTLAAEFFTTGHLGSPSSVMSIE